LPALYVPFSIPPQEVWEKWLAQGLTDTVLIRKKKIKEKLGNVITEAGRSQSDGGGVMTSECRESQKLEKARKHF
jgi:hypothetical protein